MATAAAIKFGGKAAPADPTRVPPTLDAHTTFFSPLISDEVRAAVPLLHAFSADVVRMALELLRKHFVQGSITDDEFIEIQQRVSKLSNPSSTGDFGVMLSGLYTIIRMAVYGKTPLTKINTDLKTINVPAAVADNITRVANVLRTHIEALTYVPAKRVCGFTHLQKLRWRIDVTISSGSLSRVMRPSILFQLYLTDGTVKTFEVSVEQFSQLRYSVAKVQYIYSSVVDYLRCWLAKLCCAFIVLIMLKLTVYICCYRYCIICEL
jgi:hypothetical protein